MDWIHCNYCFTQCNPGIVLFLTSCGHMFCKDCHESGVKGSQCKVCRSKCSAVKLTTDMPPDVQDFFIEPEDLFKKMASILDFQRRHRMRLINHWISITNKFSVTKEEVRRLNDLCHKLYDAVKNLREKNQNLKMQLAERQRSPSNGGLSPFPRMHSPDVISPSLSQQSVQRPAKSTPYNAFKTNLVTPSRINIKRVNNEKNQMNLAQNKMNSNGMAFLSPSPPTSAGYSKFLQSLF